MEDEREWVERCKQGDDKAFELLVKKHYERAIRIAYSVVKKREDALDVAQNAFLKAYQNLKGFSGQSSFSTWFYKIVLNQAIDWRRRGVRRESVSLDDDREGQGSRLKEKALIQPVDNPRETAFGGEIEDQIERCLEALSPEHREVLLLREVQGLPYSEIAEITGCPVGTVMSRLHYARDELRAKLASWL